MTTIRASARRPGLASALVLFVACALLAFLASPPALAGGLNDFFKKGSKESQSSSKSSESASGKNRPESGTAREKKSPFSDSDTDIWGKPGKRETGTPGKSGGLLDLFKKSGKPQPAPHGSQPDGSLPPVSYERVQPGSGGLIDLFRKPGRPQPAPSTSTSPPPAVVIYHYYDPWFYPYDRFFYRYYGPYIIREREYYFGGWPYHYERPDPQEEAEESANEALRNIERGWRESRYALIARHVDDDESIAVFHDGDYSHAMTAREFRALTLQAFEDVQTVRFRFFETRMAGTTQCMADGEHVFIGPDGTERRVELQYMLRKKGRRWYIHSIDLRQERLLSSLRAPEQVLPLLSLASFKPAVDLDEETTEARAYTGLEEELLGPPAIPAPSGPRVTLASITSQVATDEATPYPAAIVVASAAPVAVRRPVAESAIRITCESKPVRMAAVSGARNPVKVATVTCVVVQAAPGSTLVPGSRLTCDVNVRSTKDGLAWSVLHRGETRTLEAGTIPWAQLQPARTGHLRVVVDRVAMPGAAATPGEQRHTLYRKSDWDYQVALVASPKPASSQTARTELLVAPKTR